MKKTTSLGTALAVLLLAGGLEAQVSSFRSEVLQDLAGLERKYLALAGAMPQEKQAWRPGEGVRSVSELYVHVAGANYLFPTLAGAPASAEAPPRDAERTWTDRERIVTALRASFGNARAFVEGFPDADLERAYRVFGTERTGRSVILMMLTHLHEHLGQAIAYARVNGVVPPWSAGGD